MQFTRVQIIALLFYGTVAWGNLANLFCLSFLIYKMKTILVALTSQGCYED